MNEQPNAPISLDGETLTLENVRAVSLGRPVAISDGARTRVDSARAFVEETLARGAIVYGINTGFGALADVRIHPDELCQLQLNLVRSHASGIGESLPEPIIRAMMLQRANVLCKGFSGCRLVVIETLVALLNAGVHPIIPARGSVGASGDLAPLAHLALTLIGEGEAIYQDARMPSDMALERAGIAPLVLEAKEGLALLNGTQAMTSVGGLALLAAEALCHASDIIGALTLEALRGTPVAFDAKIHAVRPHQGQSLSAAHLRSLIEDSPIRESHRDQAHDPRVQDAYALRCMPQVHGAARDALAYVRRTLEIEINSATDNPLIFADVGEVLSGGNFHGAPVALGMDHAAVATATLGSISERRVERLVNPDLSGLPAFLTSTPGISSGLMIAQVAAASLIAENTVLAHPATLATLPTSANKEDHVSMGMTAALKFAQVVRNVEYILAIELLCAAQALEFLKPLTPGPRLLMVYERVRSLVPPLVEDYVPSTHIEALVPLVRELGREEPSPPPETGGVG